MSQNQGRKKGRVGQHPAQPLGWIQMPSDEREGGKEERKEGREEGRREGRREGGGRREEGGGRRRGGRREEEGGGEGGGTRSPPQHSMAQRSHTAGEDVNSRAWSWENIPGLALLLSSGGRPKAAHGGWEESPPAAPRPPPGRPQPLGRSGQL